MHELSKEFRFDAAHTLQRTVDTDPSRRIHGHSYRAEVVVRGRADPETGMVIDLGLLDRALEEARDGLDHRFLDEINDLGPATMENLSSWIWRKLQPICPNLWRVTVRRDSDNGACSYFGAGGRVMPDTSALVLFSGGQDSATCLAWALERFDRVETIGFDYGQRHRVELDVRLKFLEQLRSFSAPWAAKLGEDRVLDLTSLGGISDTALTTGAAIAFAESGLPNTFVPGRNLLFLTYASAVAYRREIKHLVTGVCETDFSGYPDCRDDTIKALQVALNLGMEKRFVIDTPLMWIDKARTWALAHSLRGQALVDLIIEQTHTCYKGDREHRHPWGFGCGTCPACELRAGGYSSWTAAA